VGAVALGACPGPVAFVCDLTSNAAGSASAAASDYVLGGLGAAFIKAAAQVGEMAVGALDSVTSIDLTASWFRANAAVIAAITLPVLVGLFVVQVIGSVLRREPGGLVRAVVGVGKAVLGASLALALTQLALTAVDEVCAYIGAAAGVPVTVAAGEFFAFAALASGLSPALQLLIGVALMAGFLLLWGVLLFRKAALVLIAVLAPIAFAGSAWDQTRVWTRRWLEIVAALVFCKVVIVVVFVVGATSFTGVGPVTGQPTGGSTPGITETLSNALVGLLLLTIAVFAPWLTWRFVHWSGMEAATVMNSAVAANPILRGARGAGTQTRAVAQQAVTSTILGGAGATKPVADSATQGTGARAGATPVIQPQPPAVPVRRAGGGQS
jgi:hypothetical protein